MSRDLLFIFPSVIYNNINIFIMYRNPLLFISANYAQVC